MLDSHTNPFLRTVPHLQAAAQVRNNILVALTDWCMSFTGVVDSHVAQLAACLADPYPLLRKQALALLACLLSKASPAVVSCMQFL